MSVGLPYLSCMIEGFEARMQFNVARRASFGDLADAIGFVGLGILRPVLDQRRVGLFFAGQADLYRACRAPVSHGLSPGGFATRPGVELGNDVRSRDTEAASGEQNDADGAANHCQVPCHSSTASVSVGSAQTRRRFPV